MGDPLHAFELPVRKGVRPETGDALPHLQLSDKSPDSIREMLKTWVLKTLPGVFEADTGISVATTRAFMLADDVPAVHPDAFMPPQGGREFAHVHLDGSMHLCVSESAITEIVEKAWGEPHPLKDQGVNEVLFYAPRDESELEFARLAVREAYYHATGRSVPIESARQA